MKLKFAGTLNFICFASMLMLSTHAEARTFVAGAAELAYVNYNSKADNGFDGNQSKEKGDSFAQRYSLAWNASNRLSPLQQQYYVISLGYDWLSFDTKTSNSSYDTSIKDVFGKFHYSGDIGYNPVNLPISFRIYANDEQPLTFIQGGVSTGLIDDGLFRGLTGKMKSEAFGVSFSFDPNLAKNVSLRGLPRLHLDYRESFNKSQTSEFLMDNATKELAVAGLSQRNNWVHFKTINYEDRIDSRNNFEQQQFQLGHVDYSGKRLWSPLTNWIEVSADGRFTNKRASTSTEEYDANFMAIATRRTWRARTFMNYNREMTTYVDSTLPTLRETARVPLYIKGSYGPETDWYMNVSAAREVQTTYSPNTLTLLLKENSYANSITVGGTAFQRSSFTLSPSLSVSTNKGYGGEDSLALVAAIETNSTARYSNKLGLAARSEFSYSDDGYNTSTSQSWSNTVSLRAHYKPDSKFAYRLDERLRIGSDSPNGSSPVGSGSSDIYLNSLTVGSVSWTPNAGFSTSLEASYDLKKYEIYAPKTETRLTHRLYYDRKETFFRLDNRYIQKSDPENNLQSWELEQIGDFQYRPDRYNETTLRYTYTKNEYNNLPYSKIDLIERYSYNFFTRTGVLRNFATLSQSIGYTSEERGRLKNYTQYLMLSGRYSPTERLSLYGSVKYENSNPGSVAIYYNAGLNADFKLLSTSLDYVLAKRDSDNRIEKRFSATVRRTF